MFFERNDDQNARKTLKNIKNFDFFNVSGKFQACLGMPSLPGHARARACPGTEIVRARATTNPKRAS
jgi:hypothetical protein